jgi:hypothetical protein
MSKDKGEKRTQHHPFFAEMLRLRLQDYYDVQTNLPVGDLPRAADIVVVQRLRDQPTPYTGLWKHLTPRNLIEFKGPTVTARIQDLDLLVELGLGIDRRLNEEETRQGRAVLLPEQMSFWYIVKSMGRRFLPDARRLVGHLDEIGPGLWRSQILQRLVFLVSSETYPTEADSLPLHLMIPRDPEQQRELTRLLAEQPELLRLYQAALSTLNSDVWKEVLAMIVRSKRTKGLKFDFSAVIEEIGLGGLLESIGIERITDDPAFKTAFKKVVKKKGVDWLRAQLTPEQIKELTESPK